METILDTTLEMFKSIGLEGKRVTAHPGYVALAVDLPNDAHAYFVWTKLDGNDFRFRVASFWIQDGSNQPLFKSSNLPDAFAKTRILSI